VTRPPRWSRAAAWLPATGLTSRLAAELCSCPVVANETYFHDDLKRLSAEQLRVERRWRRVGLELSERPNWWVLERVRRIEAELQRRHLRSGRAA
jgi:hypothetical protein